MPNAPAIRKPDSPLLPGEAEEPTLEMLGEDQPIFRYNSKKPAILGLDYLNGMYNPFKRKPNFRLYTFAQKDILSFAKNNDSSVASFFLVVTAKALDKVLPEKIRVIGGETAHNPAASLGMPHSHIDLLSHVHLDYTREQLQWDIAFCLFSQEKSRTIIARCRPRRSSNRRRRKSCSGEKPHRRYCDPCSAS